MAAILVSQNNEVTAMFVSHNNPGGGGGGRLELSFNVNNFFVQLSCMAAGHIGENSLLVVVDTL